MKTENIIKDYKTYVMPTYARYPLVIARGKGKYVWDAENKKYLDFFPGWAVSGLGHCHPLVVKRVKEQLAEIIHVPNNYYNLLQAKLAKEIIKNASRDLILWSNVLKEVEKQKAKWTEHQEAE